MPYLWTVQTIQNRACRIVNKLKKTSTVNEHLKELHWLKVQERIEFKIILLTFKCLNNLAPSYLTEILQYNNISGSRAPTLKRLLCNSTVGNRAFISYAPRLWNKLPQELKQWCSDINAFKIILKTFLFQKSYDII